MKLCFSPRRKVTELGAIAAVALLVVAWPAAAEPPAGKPATGWFQWRGAERNGISAEADWLAQWPEGGPKQLWRRTIGVGYSAVSVSDGRLYTMGNADNTDTVWCLNADTGKVIWRKSYPCRTGQHPGPRATPTVDGKVVYTISRQGDVYCFKAATGDVVWSKSLTKELKLRPPTWGFAGSPLVDGKLLIVNVSAAGVAMDKVTGKVVWHNGAGKAGYASPVLFDMAGRRCVLIFTGTGLACLDIAKGTRLWDVPWKTDYDVNAADPIVVGNTIFISSGYGTGCALLKVEDGKPSIVWRNKGMKNHFGTCVLYKGHLYGADGNAGGAAVKCIDFASGEVKWSSKRLGMASLLLSDGKLIIQADLGRLMVAEATPAAFKPLAQAQILRGQCWTMAVLADGRIYSRNSGKQTRKGELVCLDVRKSK